MEAFFVKVFIAVLLNPAVQAMLKKLLGDATDRLSSILIARVDTLEKNVLDRVEKLPTELLGDASKDVGILLHEITGTKDDIAGAVKGEVQPLLPTIDSLQTMFVNVIKDLPGGGILGGILGR